jgi:hypothetical protein
LALQVCKLFPGKHKREIIREPLAVAIHLANQLPGLDPIQLRQVLVEHDLLPADQQNGLLDAFRGHGIRSRHDAPREGNVVPQGDRTGTGSGIGCSPAC